jgi:hypothetical protein
MTDLPDLISDSEYSDSVESDYVDSEQNNNMYLEIHFNGNDINNLNDFQDNLNNYQNLIIQRNAYEVQVYDYLVNPFLLMPDNFWEPVKVCLKPHQITELTEVVIQENCIICADDTEFFREVKCCKNKLCHGCAERWFSESVKCPYCVRDLRDFI